jgi:hypothetical protein
LGVQIKRTGDIVRAVSIVLVPTKERDTKMAKMLMKEEAPTKLVFEMAPPTGSFWAEWRGPLIYPLLFLAVAFFFLFSMSTSLTWLYWVIGIGVLAVEFFMLYIMFDSAQNETVTIDLNAQRATRFEKFLSGKEKKQELALEHVSRILIHAEEVGHHCKVMLDSPSNTPLQIAFDVVFEIESLKALGNKIGSFLRKPVVLKVTDQGNLISEETIQS